ncbi:DUF2164 domain-containing protein [Patescibacteria group bacterium]|nr:DUF2164 domain-containing protein [Patescibacteria group bacterium]
MNSIKRKRDILTGEQRRTLIEQIITYFDTELDQKIGIVAAGNILDFFLQNLHADMYNHAISDCQKLLEERFDMIKIDLDLLVNK